MPNGLLPARSEDVLLESTSPLHESCYLFRGEPLTTTILRCGSIPLPCQKHLRVRRCSRTIEIAICLNLSGHHSLFSVHTLFPQVFLGVRSRVCSATRTPNSQNHSYVHYSLSKFTGEWFTNHSNHIHIFTPITRIVPTKV